MAAKRAYYLLRFPQMVRLANLGNLYAMFTKEPTPYFQ